MIDGMTVVDGFMSLASGPATAGFASEPLLADVARFFGQDGAPPAPTDTVQVLQLMDAAGVDRGVVTGPLLGGGWLTGALPPGTDPTEQVLTACEAHPDRFRAAFMIDALPRVGAIRAICRRIEELAPNPLVSMFRVVPLLVEEPINSRVFYPVYERCEALGVAVSINVGIPGPKVRAKYQDALLVDDVMIDFPDLVAIGAHMGHPWEDVLIRLMMKFENLYLSNSAYLAKYLDPRLVQFMDSGRGRGKVLFASDFPLLSFDRAVGEARKLPISEEAMRLFLGGSCLRLLGWGERPEPPAPAP